MLGKVGYIDCSEEWVKKEKDNQVELLFSIIKVISTTRFGTIISYLVECDNFIEINTLHDRIPNYRVLFSEGNVFFEILTPDSIIPLESPKGLLFYLDYKFN